MPPPVPLLADLYDMQLHRRVTHHHVADDRPTVRLARQRIVVPLVNRDPAVQRAAIVEPRGGSPCEF
jgi:hypothetical protein